MEGRGGEGRGGEWRGGEGRGGDKEEQLITEGQNLFLVQYSVSCRS